MWVCEKKWHWNRIFLWFPTVSIIPLMLHIHMCTVWRMDNGPLNSHSSKDIISPQQKKEQGLCGTRGKWDLHNFVIQLDFISRFAWLQNDKNLTFHFWKYKICIIKFNAIKLFILKPRRRSNSDICFISRDFEICLLHIQIQSLNFQTWILMSQGSTVS